MFRRSPPAVTAATAARRARLAASGSSTADVGGPEGRWRSPSPSTPYSSAFPLTPALANVAIFAITNRESRAASIPMTAPTPSPRRMSRS